MAVTGRSALSSSWRATNTIFPSPTWPGRTALAMVPRLRQKPFSPSASPTRTCRTATRSSPQSSCCEVPGKARWWARPPRVRYVVQAGLGSGAAASPGPGDVLVHGGVRGQGVAGADGVEDPAAGSTGTRCRPRCRSRCGSTPPTRPTRPGWTRSGGQRLRLDRRPAVPGQGGSRARGALVRLPARGQPRLPGRDPGRRARPGPAAAGADGAARRQEVTEPDIHLWQNLNPVVTEALIS